jgi:hypothetical protein
MKKKPHLKLAPKKRLTKAEKDAETDRRVKEIAKRIVGPPTYLAKILDHGDSLPEPKRGEFLRNISQFITEIQKAERERMTRGLIKSPRTRKPALKLLKSKDEN